MSDGEQRRIAQRRNMTALNNGTATPDENSTYLALSLELANLPKVNLKDPPEVKERLDAYFNLQQKYGVKPTVAGMSMALGIDRRRLYEIVSGLPKGGRSKWDLPQESLVYIKNAYQIMENMMESYMQNGKINPVMGIFLSKNHYGYQDVQQHTFEMSDSDKNYSADDIRKRYQIEGDYQQLSSDSADSE